MGILYSLAIHMSAQEINLQDKILIYDGVSPLFPKAWLKGKIKARADSPDWFKIATDTTEIRIAVSKYPQNLIQKKIRNIYLVGDLRFSGVYFTGTISNNVLYIASKANKDIQRTFHHEFSSILLRNYAPTAFETKWKKISPELLNCKSTTAIKDGYFSLEHNASLLNKGYLSAYSLSNWENDFNMYAENIFSGDPHFWKLVNDYPVIKVKAKLVMDFYQQVHPLFTENYFRLLENDNGADCLASNAKN